MCTEIMATMAFFPSEAGARAAIADEIAAMCSSEENTKMARAANNAPASEMARASGVASRFLRQIPAARWASGFWKLKAVSRRIPERVSASARTEAPKREAAAGETLERRALRLLSAILRS